MFKMPIKKIINFTIYFRSIIVLSKISMINIMHVEIFLSQDNI